ncbi:phosphomevalonate kinase [Malassezia brasiliensis]|uniref:phosphomevalonate kinase n=1 Tax=Malassezia brasiliensis TaxID=1821822 RepID=A0AAF0DX35_9BASI|nr:phosphomevalonate kinase [Malassezia brasiliensis]
MTTTVSAPGKVLAAGGYLVLDPAYFGVVFATDARFYTSVATRSLRAGAAPTIRVRSPQFDAAEWEYAVQLPADDDATRTEDVRLVQTDANGPNPFVAFALLYTLQLGVEKNGVSALRDALSGGMDVVIAGDNDYYSHRVEGQAPTLAQLDALEPFAVQHCTLGDVHKTGLGSSAAMTTSLTGGMLLHLGVVDDEREDHTLPLASLGLIHNTAQLAHCAAQGKLGSGFDVSASVWGSQLYRRFNPELIKDVMRDEVGSRLLRAGEAPVQDARPPVPLLPLLDPDNPAWKPAPQDSNGVPTAAEGLLELTRSADTEARVARPAPLQLPPGVRLCLADVDAGSNTRTMVGQVSTFQKNKPEWAAQLFRVLGAANQSFADGLLGLHVAHARDSEEYAHVLEAFSQRSSTEWDAYRKEHPSLTADMLIDVRNSMRSVRAGMRELGTRAQAPVEPMEMTRLIDTTIRDAPGILGGGVPGAGGYDALYLLFLHPEALVRPEVHVPAPRAVCAVWESYRELSVGPLRCGAEFPRHSDALAEVPEDVDPAVARVAQALLRTRAGLQRVDGASVPGLARYLQGLGAD